MMALGPQPSTVRGRVSWPPLASSHESSRFGRGRLDRLAESAALDLSQEVLGQLVDHLDLSGSLLLAEVLEAVVLQGGNVQMLPLGRHDHGLDEFAALRIRHADDRRLRDTGERVEAFLNLCRENEEAGGLDNVLLAVHDREVTVAVAAGEVAR